MSNGKSYSQRKRDKMDYRREYFKHNPGIFGCIWTCAYCHRPLVGKQNVQVDHIMPLNNPLGRNARYNLVAACGKCNRDKSDKFDHRVIVGYLSKCVEVAVFTIQKIAIIVIVALWVGIQKVFSSIKNLLLLPFTKSSMTTKLVAALIYVVVIYYIMCSL